MCEKPSVLRSLPTVRSWQAIPKRSTLTRRRSIPTPAYDPVHSPVRAGLDELPDLCALLRRETGRRAFGPAVQQTLGAVAIEAMDPVAQRLSVHPAIRAASVRFIPSRTAA